MFPMSSSEIYFFAEGNKYKTYEGALGASSLSSSQSWGAGTSSGTSYLPMYVESHVAGNDSAGTFVFIRNEESDSGIDDVEASRNFVLFVGAIENGAPVVSPATAGGVQVDFQSTQGYSSTSNFGTTVPRFFQKITESKLYAPIQYNSEFRLCLLEF